MHLKAGMRFGGHQALSLQRQTAIRLSAGIRSVFLQRIALIDASKRKDDPMDIIPIQCPHCLGELEVNWGVGTAVCLYCRGKMVIKLPFDHAKIAQSSLLTDK